MSAWEESCMYCRTPFRAQERARAVRRPDGTLVGLLHSFCRPDLIEAIRQAQHEKPPTPKPEP